MVNYECILSCRRLSRGKSSRVCPDYPSIPIAGTGRSPSDPAGDGPRDDSSRRNFRPRSVRRPAGLPAVCFQAKAAQPLDNSQRTEGDARTRNRLHPTLHFFDHHDRMRARRNDDPRQGSPACSLFGGTEIASGRSIAPSRGRSLPCLEIHADGVFQSSHRCRDCPGEPRRKKQS